MYGARLSLLLGEKDSLRVVVQHIFNLPIFSTNGDKEVSPSFTQEWPFFGQTHQLSYTVPYTFTDCANGFEDIRLNYRLQALMESDHTPAFAPPEMIAGKKVTVKP